MRLSLVFAGLSLIVLLGTSALAQEPIHISANLRGFSEVPSKFTAGTGTFRATIDQTAQTITFTLTFSNLTGPPAASHIHFAQKDVNGGVQVFFCDGTGHPACPTTASGTITGTVHAADVIDAGQGIGAGDFNDLVKAILAGKTYVNIHTAKFPGGEIRGQITAGDDFGEEDR
jgi:hypothetical protein